MVEVEKMNEMLVKILYNKVGEDDLVDICNFYCKSYSEFIKLIDYCKKESVLFYPNDFLDSNEKNGELLCFGGYVEDFYIVIGDNDCIQTIEVILG